VGGTLHITYRPRADTTPEGELAALVAIYRILILQKGDRNDLTGTSTKECTTSQGKKGKKNADLHGD
jgi:hypothetical protein